jgi:hypothetical protein
MILDYAKFIEHLKRTGRMKLLPQVLRELRALHARELRLAPKKETAKEYSALISGFRTLENGVLTDQTGKQALLTIYQNVTHR